MQTSVPEFQETHLGTLVKEKLYQTERVKEARKTLFKTTAIEERD